MKTFVGHTGYVQCLIIHENILYLTANSEGREEVRILN